MQLTLETPGSANVISAMEHNRLRIGGQWLTGNLIVSADTVEPNWPATSAEALAWPQLEPLVAMEPEIILIGTGGTLRFPPAALAADVLGRGIGFEVMDTAAACRTYNILVTEQRRVVAGILQAAE